MPPRKSAAALEASGAFAKNPNRRRFNPAVVSGDLVVPDFIQSDELALHCWGRTVDALRKLKVVSQTDAMTIESFCIAWSNWQKALKLYRIQGPTATGKFGPVRNPVGLEMLAQQTLMNKLASELGLSPSGRARLTVDPMSDDDPFTEWLKESSS